MYRPKMLNFLLVASLAHLASGLQSPHIEIPLASALQSPQIDAFVGRRIAVHAVAAALATIGSRPALAEYGEAAVQAVPAMVPSPIRPTGAMAETCDVVALGREDVCLEPKKLISSYEAMQLSRASEALADSKSFAAPELIPLLEATAKLADLVNSNKFADIELVVAGMDTAPLFARLSSGSADDKKLLKGLSVSLNGLSTAAKKKEASPAAKALIKLSEQLCTVVDDAS